MLSTEITSCPHCGGTTGYKFDYVTKGTQYMGFGRRGLNNADCEEGTPKHKASKCQDCNKIIRAPE